MCLSIIRKSRLKFKIAKEDIIVYKIVYTYGKERCRSVTMNYKYKVGEVCAKVRIKPKYRFNIFEERYEIRIYEAYHYYSIKNKIFVNGYDCDNSYDYKNKSKKRIAQFIIPRGTRYYYNMYSHLGVAESIIFNKILNKREIMKLREIL